MYNYDIVNDKQFKITGDNYNSIFNGVEVDAIEKITELEGLDSLHVVTSKRKDIEETLEGMTNKTIELTNKKYRLTDAMGLTTIIRDEYARWKLDNTYMTPTIDGWAIDKGKSRDEQLASTGVVILFTEKASKIQELAWSRLESSTTVAQIDSIGSALLKIQGCKSTTCVIEIADIVLEELRNI